MKYSRFTKHGRAVMADKAESEGRKVVPYYQRYFNYLDTTSVTDVPLKTGDDVMEKGLYFFGTPSGGSVCVLRIGWIRPKPGGDPDEYEVLNQIAPRRPGDYRTSLDEVALKGPPKSWTLRKPFPLPCPIHRLQIFHPLPCDEKVFEKICPRPADF